MFRHILIAYDESKEACRALKTGIELGATLHARTTLLTVLEPLPGYVNMACAVAPTLPTQILEERRTHFKEVQATAKRSAAEQGLDLETILIEGEEIPAIIAYTRETHADLLVLGLHRHAQGIDWRGTMRCIANETPCPILAVC